MKSESRNKSGDEIKKNSQTRKMKNIYKKTKIKTLDEEVEIWKQRTRKNCNSKVKMSFKKVFKRRLVEELEKVLKDKIN